MRARARARRPCKTCMPRPDNDNLWQDLCEFCQDEGTSGEIHGRLPLLLAALIRGLGSSCRRQGLDASRLPRAPGWRRHGARLRVHEASTGNQSTPELEFCLAVLPRILHVQAIRKPARQAVLSAPRTEGKTGKAGAMSERVPCSEPQSTLRYYVVDCCGEL